MTRRRSGRSAFALVVLATAWLVAGVGHADATVRRGVSEDQVQAATDKLAKSITGWQRAVTGKSATDWPTYAGTLDRRAASLRSSFEKWQRVLDQYIPDHLGDRGVVTLGRFQVAVREWVPDQEAFVDAVHACIGPPAPTVDDTAVRSCLTQSVDANRAQFQQHEKAILSVLRDAKRLGLD